MALGIIMGGEHVDEQQAFALLAGCSQHSNRKLAEVALDVVRTGSLPD